MTGERSEAEAMPSPSRSTMTKGAHPVKVADPSGEVIRHMR